MWYEHKKTQFGRKIEKSYTTVKARESSNQEKHINPSTSLHSYELQESSRATINEDGNDEEFDLIKIDKKLTAV